MMNLDRRPRFYGCVVCDEPRFLATYPTLNLFTALSLVIHHIPCSLSFDLTFWEERLR